MTEFEDLSNDEKTRVRLFIVDHMELHCTEHHAYSVDANFVKSYNGKLELSYGEECKTPETTEEWFECVCEDPDNKARRKSTVCGMSNMSEYEAIKHAMVHLGLTKPATRKRAARVSK